jgi:Zn ribbon nucleic-acid-binding protein
MAEAKTMNDAANGMPVWYEAPKPGGAACPQCGEVNRAYCRRDKPIRYHKCVACGLNYKSIERETYTPPCSNPIALQCNLLHNPVA